MPWAPVLISDDALDQWRGRWPPVLELGNWPAGPDGPVPLNSGAGPLQHFRDEKDDFLKSDEAYFVQAYKRDLKFPPGGTWMKG